MRGLLLLFVCAVMVGCGARQVGSRYITPVTSFPAEVYREVMSVTLTKAGDGAYAVQSNPFNQDAVHAYYLLLLKGGEVVDRVYVPSHQRMYGPSSTAFSSSAQFDGVAVEFRRKRY